MINIGGGKSIMSERWYVVREYPRELLDIIPGHISNYDNNIRVRHAYSVLRDCDISLITLLNDKDKAKHYEGWIIA